MSIGDRFVNLLKNTVTVIVKVERKLLILDNQVNSSSWLGNCRRVNQDLNSSQVSEFHLSWLLFGNHVFLILIDKTEVTRG
jgi:hypothetical protein